MKNKHTKLAKQIKHLQSGPATNKPTVKQREGKTYSQIIEQAVLRTRTSISDWRTAIKIAENVYNPKRVKLYNIYSEIILDSLLTSQVQNRKLRAISSKFELIDANGEVDEDSLNLIIQSKWLSRLLDDLLDTNYWGFTVIELYTTVGGELDYRLIPRKHIIPEQGLITKWEGDLEGIAYREMREYGSWILDFGKPKDLGLFNKTVPHVLMKRFAQSCWSELCEIYGIPPRIGKTNTQDPEMLGRMERMMREMGSAAWMIIDDTEEFEFAQGVSTKGEVYESLIRLCNNEISLLFSGAVIGQDTKNGNESKETISIGLLDQLVESDKKQMVEWWNSILLPALYRIGFLPEGLTFRYPKQEDLAALWKMTMDAAERFDIPPEYINDKFGIPVKPKTGLNDSQKLSRRDGSFFD
jgi:phage gp29-like protein